MPRFGKISFEMSQETPNVFAGGLPGCLIAWKVGNESSSATNGSSVAKVAGKNRLAANPCENVGKGTATRMMMQADINATCLRAGRFRKYNLNILGMSSRPLERATLG
jgi:hypothetical protein